MQARIAHGIYTQEEFVEAFEKAARELGLNLTVSIRQVRRWESKQPGWPHPATRTVLCALLCRPVEQLGFSRRTRRELDTAASGSAQGGPVKRRDFVTYSLAAASSVVVPEFPEGLLAPPAADPLDRLRDVLAGTVVRDAEPITLAALDRDTAVAKGHVQGCRYAQLATSLPRLILEVEQRRASAGEQYRVDCVATNAYHVAASLFLKHGDAPSAWVAADRAMAAVRRTEQPKAIASASRILTHAVAAVGHRAQGIGVAIRGADRIAGSVARSRPDTVAVFGALLLRGAWAAAAAGERHAAAALLDDAERAAGMLGDSNRQWTAFGPSNVLLHRVSIALTLGDAGKALTQARKVSVESLTVAERRAVFWTDVARALHACGRGEKATAALLAAEREAPQEVRSRTVVRELIGDLLLRDRAGREPHLRSLAARARVVV
ncbi:hypothetical protein ACX9I7_09705 [Streptomyces sp. L500]